MTTISLEGSGVTVSFSASGFSGDVIDITLTEKARQTIETTHLATKEFKTYKLAETDDLGTLTIRIDHNPALLNLIGYPAESIVISYPLQNCEVVPQTLNLHGIVYSQGGEMMKMDERMVTKIIIKLTFKNDDYVFIPDSVIQPSLVWLSSGSDVSSDKTNDSGLDFALIPTLPSVIAPDSNYYIEVDCAGSMPTSGKIPCVGIADTDADINPYPGQNRGEWGVQYDINPYVISRNTASVESTLSGLASVSKRLGIAIRLDYAGAIKSIQVCTTSGSFLQIYSLNGNTSSSASPKRPRLQLGWGAIPSGASGFIRAKLYQKSSEWVYSPPSGYSAIP